MSDRTRASAVDSDSPAAAPAAAAAMLRTAGVAAIVAGLAGLCEGLLLAWIHDPFGAGWSARVWSSSLFAASYLVAGFIAGGLLAIPLQLLRLAKRRPGAAAYPLVCSVVGLFYARAWSQALQGTRGFSPVRSWLLSLAAALLFAAAGYWVGALLPRFGFRAGVIPAALAASIVVVSGFSGPPARRDAGPAERPLPVERQAPSVRAPQARNVLVILADTLRADHLSLYGYARSTSPSLLRFASGGVTFTNAITQKTKTSPSVASLFTGTYPHTHGIVNCRTVLPNEAVTLAEVLRDRGFDTHSIVANPNVGIAFNFGQGFDSVDEVWSDPRRTDARGVTDQALAWLTARSGSARAHPFFLYVHYIDPHIPYAAPSPFREMFVDDPLYGRLAKVKLDVGDASIGSVKRSAVLAERPNDVDYYVARYDGEIAYLDHHVARLLEGLSGLHLDADTLVVFTADHGEALSEHDVFFTHGDFAYEDTARVPLILRLPGRIPAGRRIDGVVETTALAPTVLQALGLPPAGSMEVTGFWDLVTASPGSGEEASREAFVESGTVASSLRTAIRTGRWKLIENPVGFDRTPGRFDLPTVLNMSLKVKALELMTTGREFLSRFELYDVAADPAETINLADREPEVTGRLLSRLRSWRARAEGHGRLAPSPDDELPEEIRRNLKSLGYVQ